MKCPKCQGDYVTLHVVVEKDIPVSEVMCWKCAAEDVYIKDSKWIGSID